MPIYEYVCAHCGNEIEKLQGMSDAPLTDCAICGESALKRKVSAPSFRLAGGGWYETDFKKDGRRNLASSASDKKDSAGAKSEAKSTAKSDTSGDKGKSSKPSKPKTADAK